MLLDLVGFSSLKVILKTGHSLPSNFSEKEHIYGSFSQSIRNEEKLPNSFYEASITLILRLLRTGGI